MGCSLAPQAGRVIPSPESDARASSVGREEAASANDRPGRHPEVDPVLSGSARTSQPLPVVSTILPMWPLSSISRWASSARSSGKVACTMGLALPASISGQTSR